MPKSCVVGGCTRNSAKQLELRFFEFPKKNETVRRQWIKFVETTRSDFCVSKWSLVCGEHFSADCQDPQSKMKATLGIVCKYRLRKDAVPSLKSATLPNSSPVSKTPQNKRSSNAITKRERCRILKDAFTEYDMKYGSTIETPSSTQGACTKSCTSTKKTCKQDNGHISGAAEATSVQEMPPPITKQKESAPIEKTARKTVRTMIIENKGRGWMMMEKNTAPKLPRKRAFDKVKAFESGETSCADSIPAETMGEKKMCLSLEDRVKLIEEMENRGCRKMEDISAQWGVKLAATSRIMKNKKTIRARYHKKYFTKCKKTEKDPGKEQFQKELVMKAQFPDGDLQCSAILHDKAHSCTCKYSYCRAKIAREKSTPVGCLSLEDKVKLIEEVENRGCRRMVDLSGQWGISLGTLSYIMKNKEFLKEQYKQECLEKTKLRLKTRTSQVEEAVLMWFKAAYFQKIPLSRPTILEKARSLAKKLGHVNFTCSDEWLDRFETQKISRAIPEENGHTGGEDHDYGQKSENGQSEITLSDNLTKDHRVYAPEDIFSVVESGLFYRLLPDRLLTFKQEFCKGTNRCKEQLILVVAANMDGSEKLPLLVIGKSQKPQCFANVKSLPTQYEASSTAWMTPEIFEAWVRNVDKLYQEKNRRILIIVDSWHALPRINDLKKVTLDFRPTNVTPMDQGIIHNLKINYRRQLITSFLAAADRKEKYNLTVLDAMILLKKSWKMIKEITIARCFEQSNACFQIKKMAAALGSKTAEPKTVIDIDTSAEDKALFDQLRDAGFHIPQETTLESYAAVDADVGSSMALNDDAIIDAILAILTEEKNCEGPATHPVVSIAEAKQHLDKLQDFLLQNNHFESMFDGICNFEKVIGLIQKSEKIANFKR